MRTDANYIHVSAADQCHRLGWQELGGFAAGQDEDGRVILTGAIGNRRAKLIPETDGSGGYVLLVDQDRQQGVTQIPVEQRGLTPIATPVELR